MVHRSLTIAAMLLLAVGVTHAHGQMTQHVVDIPTRPGVTQRVLVLTPPVAKAVVILLAGGHGGLQINSSGAIQWGGNNFLVRSNALFVEQGLQTILVDAPSDRQTPSYLSGFRQTGKHLADIQAVIAWSREQSGLPVWLMGTSRGTQSAAFVATESVGQNGPDGLVLSSTVLTDNQERPVPDMPLDRLRIPVLVVHHELDGCRICAFSDMPRLIDKLGTPRRQLLSFTGGENQGDPCKAAAYHGYNGIEREVAQRIAAWILGP